ncbi:MAG: methyl-accepting chemotaxis protein [Acidaminobacteraceae bacterium]
MKKSENVRVKRGIRQVILSGFLVILILTQVITSVATYSKSSKVIRDSTIEATDGITTEIGIAVENYLATYEQIIRTLAREDSLKNLNGNLENELRTLDTLKNYVDVDSDILYIYLGTSDGRMIMKPDDDLGDDYDPRKRDWYKDTIESGDFIWTDPYMDDTVGMMVVSASMPVYSDAGELTGVLALDLALGAINEQSNKVTIGEKGYPIVVDANNIIMAHKDSEKLGTVLTSVDLVEALKDESKTGVTYTYDSNGKSKEKYAAITRLNSTGWVILATTYFDEIDEELSSLIYITVLASAVSLFLSGILVFLLTRKFINNIKILLSTMQKVRTGDLSAKSNVDSKDEIGVLSRFFDDTISDLGKLVDNVQGASLELTQASQNLAATSEEVSASSDEVARTVEDIAIGAQDQAEDSEKGSIIASELSEKVLVLNELKTSMLESAKSLQVANDDGIESVEELKEKNIDSIKANKEIEKVIGELNERTTLIGSILDSISAIAVQTNLLALNASIEAARAGEHGRGFAVVADEIRKLAEESSTSANEVRDIVENIQSDSKKSVDSMGELKLISTSQNIAVVKVVKAFEMIKKADEIISINIEKISDSVTGLSEDKDKIVSSIENISAVSEETAAASEEVTASMQQQVHAIEEVAKSAQRLNEISLGLSEEISKFSI